MKNLFTILTILIASSIYSNAQISIRTESCTKQIQQVETYDSLSNLNLNYDIIANEYQTENLTLTNINGQFKQFIGQNIYILPLTQKETSFNSKWERMVMY